MEFNLLYAETISGEQRCCHLDLAILNAPVDTLRQEEWEVLQAMCTILEPFEQVTVELSSERYVFTYKIGHKCLILNWNKLAISYNNKHLINIMLNI